VKTPDRGLAAFCVFTSGADLARTVLSDAGVARFGCRAQRKQSGPQSGQNLARAEPAAFSGVEPLGDGSQ